MTAGPASGPVDVAVIGGGIVGTAAAAFLAEAGARVALFETAEIASAASGRNSGVVQHPFDPVLAALYRETVDHLRGLAAVPAAGFALSEEPAGLLAVGTDPAEAGRIAAAWGATHPAVSVEVIDGSDLVALEPSLAPDLVACRLGIGFPVAPAAASRAFAERAVSAGAVLSTGRRARVATRGGVAGGIEVDGEAVAAGAVVVAAGPWTPSVVDPSGGWQPIVRSWGVVVTIRLAAPPRHVVEEAMMDIEPASEIVPDALDFHLVPAGLDSALGSTFLRDEPEPAALVDRLVRRGSRFVPSLVEARVSGVRACARPVAADGRPLVGAVPGIERLFVAAGHGPWGISTGPATARLVADRVIGRGTPIPPALDPARFGPVRLAGR